MSSGITLAQQYTGSACLMYKAKEAAYCRDLDYSSDEGPSLHVRSYSVVNVRTRTAKCCHINHKAMNRNGIGFYLVFTLHFL